jgi:hypothetical protein
MKNKIVLSLFVIAFVGVKAQVNLQKGTLQKSIPIYQYVESSSNMGLNLSLSYTSGNGLVVDQVSGSVGTGWTLLGVSSITRIQKGQPDDQFPIDGFYNDTTKFPPGYLYNNDPISQGCPTALNQYPIFNGSLEYYTQHNKTLADRELDEFQLDLGGRLISFVLDKNNLQKAIVIDKSRLKIKVNVISGGNLSRCRTTIENFEVTDENGIVYEFSAWEKTKIYDIGQGFKSLPQPKWNTWSIDDVFDKSNELLTSNYNYVVNTWKITKIKDTKSKREIIFEYINQDFFYEYISMSQASLINCYPIPRNSCPQANGQFYYKVHCVPPTPSWPSYDGFVTNLKGAILKNTITKREISKIILPDNNTIEFNYNTTRKDISNTNAISSIIIKNRNVKLYSFELQHEYFIKNEIRQPNNADDEKWSRLCLKSVKKVGGDDVLSEKPYVFDYYIGTNTREDFVPPAFFHAKDPWGYYNGSYSGTPTDRLLELKLSDIPHWANSCIYNQASYAEYVELIYNCKPGYAKNGLLKSVTYPSGGVEIYEYEQNYIFPTIEDYHQNKYQAFDYRLNSSGQAEYTMGGVSLSKIIQKNIDGINDRVIKYDYTMPDGTSSMWGVETGLFISSSRYYYKPELKTFSAGICDYDYKFTAKSQYQAAPSPSDIFTPLSVLNYAINLSKVHNSAGSKSSKLLSYQKFTLSFIQGLIISYITKLLNDCFIEAAPVNSRIEVKYHNQLNNNLLPIQYKRTTTSEYSSNYFSNGLSTGKTVYDFTSPDDFPLLIPSQPFPFTQKPRGYYWMYGLPKIITTYDNTGFVIKKVENNYGHANEILSGNNTQSCNCESNYFKSKRNGDWNDPANISQFTNITSSDLKVDFYNLATGYEKLTSSKETIFSKSNGAIETINNFTYNPNNKLVSTSSAINNKGYVVEKRLYYPEDYNLTNSNNSALLQLVNSNKVSSLVSSETWQKKGFNIPEMLSTSVLEFGIAPNGDYKPIKTYGLQTDKPVPQSTIGVFDPNKLIRNPAGQPVIIPTTEIAYDAIGNMVQAKDVQGNRTNSTIYAYKNTLPIAALSNAGINEVAYTSFENEDAYSGSFVWNLGSTGISGILNSNTPTGKYYSSPFAFISSDVITNKNKEYKLSFWANSGNFTVTSSNLVNPVLVTQKIAAPTINGWTYYEYDIAPTNAYCAINIKANGANLDELRLYPKSATMATTTYDVGIGKTSECDINNRIVYYEYDGLGRMTKMLDENRNIIKTYEYNFKK